VKKEPEPDIPPDFQEALAATPEARKVWNNTTTIARVDWIHWITSAKQLKTRAKRIGDACDMLASGKKQVCCFDQSGYYSKAFRAPEAEIFKWNIPLNTSNKALTGLAKATLLLAC